MAAQHEVVRFSITLPPLSPSDPSCTPAQADDGVLAQVDLTATASYMYLDGDFEDDATGDSINQVTFAAGEHEASTLGCSV